MPREAVAFQPPPGFQAVRIAGRLAVGAVWARYGAAGALAYDELAVGVLVRRGLTLAVTLPWIWVDSAVSMAAARRRWAIPKQLARFSPAGADAFEAADGAGVLARARFASILALPGRWPLRVTIAQARDGEAVLTPARIRARLALARSAWQAVGPLSWLDRRTPYVSLRLVRAEMLFGRRKEALH